MDLIQPQPQLKYVFFLSLFLSCSLILSPVQSQVITPRSGKIRIGMDMLNDDKVSVENVHINGTEYPVPAQWQGRRIDAPPLAIPALVQIPVELTHDGTKIYVLAAANKALVAMAAKAKEDNVILSVHSGYRSAWYQKKIFQRMLKQDRTFEDIVRFVAPPGYSEHMLGTVVDLYPSNWRFADTDAYVWLLEHAAEFGFRETYPEKRDDGMFWEPWHWKYTVDATATEKESDDVETLD